MGGPEGGETRVYAMEMEERCSVLGCAKPKRTFGREGVRNIVRNIVITVSEGVYYFDCISTEYFGQSNSSNYYRMTRQR